MKRLIFLVALLTLMMISSSSHGQIENIIYGKQVTVKTRDTSSAELKIVNSTRNVPGYLKNIGGGLTRFTLPDYNELINKPTTFPPSSHTHGNADITDLAWSKLTGVPDLVFLTRFIDSLVSVQGRINSKLNITDAASTYITITRTLDSLAALRSANATKLNITDAVSTYITIARTLDSLVAVQARIQTKEPLLGFTPVPNTRTINGYALTSDITLNKSDVGLSNVPNTDATNASNISSGTLPDARLSSNVTVQGNSFNAANQLVKLDAGGKLPTSTIPSLALVETFVVNSQAAMLALSAQMGDVAVRTDNNRSYILQSEPASTLSNWVQLLTPDSETDPVYTASSWYSTTNNASNWNTAYSWGNHASAGYALTSGSYSNPTWITSLAWSKITGAPAFLTSESDPVYVASSWYSTTNNSSNWNTAYSWGNHASAGYAISSRTITINGTTYDLSANRSWSVGTITGGGTTGNIPQWSSATGLGNSPISVSGSWIFTNGYTLVSNHTSVSSAAKNLALVDNNTGSSNSTAIYMGYNANGGDPYGARIVQTGNPGSTRRGGFKFQSHGDVTGDTDAHYYDLLSLDTEGNGTFRSTVTAQINNGTNTWTPILNLVNNSSGANDWALGKPNVNDLGIRNETNGYYAVTFINQGSYADPIFTGNMTAASYTGSGIGLTGTASGLNIGGQSLLLGSSGSSLTAQRGNGTVALESAITEPQTGLFTTTDNSNAIITINRHPGNYYSQLGFNSTGSIFYRSFNNTAINTSLAWQTLLTSSNFSSYAMAGAGYSANQNLNTSSNVSFATIDGSLIRSTGDVIAYYTSDRRLKKNIRPIANALDKISRLSGNEYDWNEDLQSTYKGHDYGVIAQEIESVLPGVTHKKADGFFGVKNQNQIIALLIQALKELKHEVELLKR